MATPTIPERVATFREAYRRKYVGARYSGRAHFAFTSGVALAAIGFSLSRLEAVRPLEWLTVPAVFPTVGWLFAASAVGYYLTYEWLHFCHHLPPEHPVARLPLMARLRRHRQTHHDPSKMQRYHFNITLPLLDWFFGTAWRPGDSERGGASRGLPPSIGTGALTRPARLLSRKRAGDFRAGSAGRGWGVYTHEGVHKSLNARASPVPPIKRI